MNNHKKIGLALGSGGPRGLAHIGVIKVLEESGIAVDFIAGSSIGALIGGLYAASKDIRQIEELALSMGWRQAFELIDPSFSQGLVGGDKIEKYIEKHIGVTNFQDLKIPLSVMATDLKSGETVCLDAGPIAPAIRASIAMPLVFKPVELGGRLLTDGGFSVPVPAEIVRSMGADLVLAANLDNDYFGERSGNPGFYRIAESSINLLRHHLSRANAQHADVVVSPRVGNVGWDEFLAPRDAIATGEAAMRAQLPKLRELI